MRYGPYYVVINGSEEKRFRYEIPEDMRGKAATELLTGEHAPLESFGIIPSFSSRVFVLSNPGKGAEVGPLKNPGHNERVHAYPK